LGETTLNKGEYQMLPSNPKSLLQLMNDEKVIIAPGVWDGLSAVLADQAGFQALFSSGFAIAASMGLPDAELYSVSDNLNAVRLITSVSNLPLICDVDTGYGNSVNVRKTVKDFGRAGASALIIEDNLSPKRCPLCAGMPAPLLPIHEAALKIKAAVDTREREDLLIIARTDGVGEDAIKRSEAYVEAGADLVVFISKAFPSIKDWEKRHKSLGVPLVAIILAPTWIGKEFTSSVMEEIGVKIALHPLDLLFASTTAMQAALSDKMKGVPITEMAENYISAKRFSEVIGFHEIEDFQNSYLPKSL
jgi:2-methylisocitrate lyase-like PEP mutase family enzyme